MKIRLVSNEVLEGAAARVKFCLNLHNSLFTILLFVLIYGTQEIMAQGQGANLDFPQLDISKEFLEIRSTSKTGDPNYDSWAEVNRTYGVFKDMMKKVNERRKREIEREERQRKLKKWLNEEYRKQIGDDKFDDKKRDATSSLSRRREYGPGEVFIIGVFAFICVMVRMCWKACLERDKSPSPVTNAVIRPRPRQPSPVVESTPYVQYPIPITNRAPSPYRPPVESFPYGTHSTQPVPYLISTRLVPNPTPMTNRTPSPYRPPMESLPYGLSPVPFSEVESTPSVQNPIPMTNRALSSSPSNRPPAESLPYGLSSLNDESPSAPPLSSDDRRQEDLPPSYEEVTSAPARNQKISGPSW